MLTFWSCAIYCCGCLRSLAQYVSSILWYSFWGIVFYIRNIILLGFTTKKRYSRGGPQSRGPAGTAGIYEDYKRIGVGSGKDKGLGFMA